MEWPIQWASAFGIVDHVIKMGILSVNSTGYRVLRFLSICVLVAASALLATSPAAAAELLGARFGPNGEKTRLVIDLKGAPEYSVHGDGEGAGRIIISFSDLTAPASLLTSAKGKGHFARYQFKQVERGRVDATFEFKKTARIKEAFLLEPKDGVKKHRLVVDVETATKAAFLQSLPQKYTDLAAVIEQATTADTAPVQASTRRKPTAPTAKERNLSAKLAPTPSLAPPVKKVVVVIDPGHGGADPGATGINGTQEKTITLSAALELEKILKKTGRYKVVLTRRGDTKIRPDAREALARDAHADLFISLHADAIGNKNVRGASVYTLSKEGTKRSAEKAREQGNYIVNETDLNSEIEEDVSTLLFKLVQRETNNSSSQFAEILIKNLGGVTPMLNRSHRTGDLRVLLAPDVPAVLLEMAFISNMGDETNLNSPKWRRKTMMSVADAINQFFDEREPERHAATGAGGAK